MTGGEGWLVSGICIFPVMSGYSDMNVPLCAFNNNYCKSYIAYIRSSYEVQRRFEQNHWDIHTRGQAKVVI